MIFCAVPPQFAETPFRPRKRLLRRHRGRLLCREGFGRPYSCGEYAGRARSLSHRNALCRLRLSYTAVIVSHIVYRFLSQKSNYFTRVAHSAFFGLRHKIVQPIGGLRTEIDVGHFADDYRFADKHRRYGGDLVLRAGDHDIDGRRHVDKQFMQCLIDAGGYKFGRESRVDIAHGYGLYVDVRPASRKKRKTRKRAERYGYALLRHRFQTALRRFGHFARQRVDGGGIGGYERDIAGCVLFYFGEMYVHGVTFHHVGHGAIHRFHCERAYFFLRYRAYHGTHRQCHKQICDQRRKKKYGYANQPSFSAFSRLGYFNTALRHN